ncbi:MULTISPECIES: PadR family transcriptional regulator [Amycolatopsis]|uniref:Transcriptional regulator PadR-like family protein n=2 Tax=Amycolatopsis rubida TaxID=112413 RepID=A0A1I5EUX8_9PSEU|nr:MULTISPECIES: PadR family transcriptional regulator [Amycolatopsis]OAP27221.1 Transcriptional regulator PadR-like family protein [Amycolatopsis sp. M39]SFO15314.1 Transcriptional regulator PadR-like family protein [Amycolatopsis rubida]
MKRRKVSNMLGLAVLSTLCERPMHPYEVATLLRERGKEGDLKIKWGSLYTVVGNLEKHGFVEAVENVREGARPERTVYRITEAGQAELEDWVAELLGAPDPEPTRFHTGLSVMLALGPEVVARQLGHRVGELERMIEDRVEVLAKMRTEQPRLVLVEAEYQLAMWRAEAEWVRGLYEELATGAIPGVEEWRRYRETGELPDMAAFVGNEGE